MKGVGGISEYPNSIRRHSHILDELQGMWGWMGIKKPNADMKDGAWGNEVTATNKFEDAASKMSIASVTANTRARWGPVASCLRTFRKTIQNAQIQFRPLRRLFTAKDPFHNKSNELRSKRVRQSWFAIEIMFSSLVFPSQPAFAGREPPQI